MIRFHTFPIFPYFSLERYHFDTAGHPVVNPNSCLAHQILLGVRPLASACGLESVSQSVSQSVSHWVSQSVSQSVGRSLSHLSNLPHLSNCLIMSNLTNPIHSTAYELPASCMSQNSAMLKTQKNTGRIQWDGRKILQQLGQLMLQPVSTICYLGALPRRPLTTKRHALKPSISSQQ